MRILRALFPGVTFVLVVAGSGLATAAPSPESARPAGRPTTAAKPGAAIQVLDRATLGGYIEETAIVSSGPFANHIAMTNGRTVYGVPMSAKADAAIRPLFDSRAVGWDVPPKGMAYVDSEQAFAFVEGGTPEMLFLADNLGRPLPPRPITYLPEPLNFLHNEGLLYLPPTAPAFGDHLLMLANRFPDEPPFIDATIEVLRRDGVVVAQIVPEAPLGENYLTGLAQRGDDRLLIGMFDQIWTIDFAGRIVDGPVAAPGNIEGLEQLPGGRIVMSASDRLYFFDGDLHRLPQYDRDAGIGPGLLPQSIAWNSDAGDFLLAASAESTGDYFQPHDIYGLSPALDAAVSRFTVPTQDRSRLLGGIDYLPAERRIAALLWRQALVPPGQIVIYDLAGTAVERFPVPRANGSQSPSVMTYLPQTNEFAVVYRGASRDHKIVIVSRTGQLVREIDLLPQGVNFVAALTPSTAGDRIVVFGSGSVDDGRSVVIDLQGAVLQRFNWRNDLGMLGVGEATTVTSGPQAGAFVALDVFPGFEAVVFRLG